MLPGMITIPTTEPAEITAGDTIRWTKSLSDYPADTYALHYKLQPLSGGDSISIDATASGTDHTIEVSAALSAAYTAGNYIWTSYVLDIATGLERTTIDSSQITIKPDPLTSTADLRSTVRKIYDAIEATILGEASSAQLKIIVDGDTLEKKSTADLLGLESRYRLLVKQEEQADAINKGLRTGKRIVTRFLD